METRNTDDFIRAVADINFSNKNRMMITYIFPIYTQELIVLSLIPIS
jgi:hypothetical protein